MFAQMLKCFIYFVIFEFVLINANPLCKGKESCGECLQAHSSCNWCSLPSFDLDRCASESELVSQNCPKNNQIIHASHLTILQNQPLSQVETEENVIQMQPQRIQIDLRLNQSIQFEIKFRQVIDYPLDLYYLMDLSNTMRDDREILASLADSLAENMQRITRNFRIGFGSFVDKTTLPFIKTTAKELKEPCRNCAPPYSFRNQMPLNVNTKSFAKQVRDAPISGNLDGPEGGLDAIMQAIVCRDQIGWRQDARKLLLFSTDASFHYAGDGRLAGINRPNDQQCHLDADGFYNASTVYDYPSINQIAHKAKSEKVHIIFAVTSIRTEMYGKLSKQIDGSSVAELNHDSSNVVELLQAQYERITSSIRLVDNGTDIFQLRYFSACLHGNASGTRGDTWSDTWAETNTCEQLKVGSQVSFNVSIKLIQCPPVGQREQTIQVSAAGLSDRVLIHVRARCDCDCEQLSMDNSNGNPTIDQQPSIECSSAGHMKCGLCDCLSGAYGRKCECKSKHRSGSEEQSLDGCRSSNETQLCNGNGRCKCNTCICDVPFHGTHCECDPLSCERVNGFICNGPERGVCDCGKCKCAFGWTGSACQCPLSDQTCKYSFNGQVCNSHGQCRCGQCECDEPYRGTFCHICTSCNNQMCLQLLPRVANQIARKIDQLQDINVTSVLVDQLDQRDLNRLANALNGGGDHDTLALEDAHAHDPSVFGEQDVGQHHMCELSYAQDGCVYSFVVRYTRQGTLNVSILRNPKCPEPLSVKQALSQLSIGVLAMGVLTLLLWRLITYCLDKKEYEQFIRQVKNAQWEEDQNPLYKPSTSNFKNPAYSSD